METPAVGDIWEYVGSNLESFYFLIVAVHLEAQSYTDCKAIYLANGEARLISVVTTSYSSWRKVA